MRKLLSICISLIALSGWGVSREGYCFLKAEADHIFIASIAEIEDLASGHRLTLRVLENLKGEATDSVVLLTSREPGCSFDRLLDSPRVRQQHDLPYVIFAKRSSDGLFRVQDCVAIRPAWSAMDEIDAWRWSNDDSSSVKRPSPAFLYGRIIRPARSLADKNTELTLSEMESRLVPMPQIKLTVTGTDGPIAHLQTDAKGRFYTPIAPGHYTLKADLDDRFTGNKRLPVEIAEDGCANVSLYVGWNGSISGRLTLDGEVLSGYRVAAVPVELEDIADSPYLAFSEPDGSFAIAGLPPGSYQLLLKHGFSGKRELAPVFFPDANSRSAATAISVGEGEKVGPLEFSASRQSERQAQFIMVWKDGTPVESGEIYVEYENSFPYRSPEYRSDPYIFKQSETFVRVYGDGMVRIYAIARDKNGKEWTSGAAEIHLSDAGAWFTLRMIFDEPAPQQGSPVEVPVQGTLR
jgi:hypothetical protein